jgi:hypothetical protein
MRVLDNRVLRISGPKIDEVKGSGENYIMRSLMICRWQDNIKVDLWDEGCGGIDWIVLAENRDRWLALVNALMNLWVP